MSALVDDGTRNLLPRWRYAARSAITAEHHGDPRYSLLQGKSPGLLDSARQEFIHTPTLGTALDLVHVAATLNEPDEARKAADFLRKAHSRLSSELQSLLAWIDDPQHRNPRSPSDTRMSEDPSEEQARRIIAANRIHLGTDPRNSMRWIDISRAHTILGHTASAERALRVAIGLTPNHRVSIRTFARWLVHSGRTEEAWIFVSRHARTQSDPWLMALELSLAAILKTAPAFAVRGRKLALAYAHEPGFVSELASSLATLDLQSGDYKRSRKLFRLSLLDPTDNAVAQVQWAAKRDPSLSVDHRTLERPQNVEARYWKAMAAQSWDTALEEVQAWQEDEPFSHRPAINGSYVATTLANRPDLAIPMAQIGLRADPDAHMIRNNLVVSLVLAGKIDEAIEQSRTLRTVSAPAYPEFVQRATLGLVAFAVGDIAQARSHYDEAADKAPTDHDKIRVLIHRFEGESIANPSLAARLLPKFEGLWRLSKDPAITALGQKVLERHEARHKQPLLLVDPRTNAPILNHRGNPLWQSK